MRWVVATTGYVIVTSHQGVPRELSRSALLPYGFLSAFEEYTAPTRLFLSTKQDVPILPRCTGRLGLCAFYLCLRQGAGRQFAWFEVGSGKIVLSHPARQRVPITAPVKC